MLFHRTYRLRGSSKGEEEEEEEGRCKWMFTCFNAKKLHPMRMTGHQCQGCLMDFVSSELYQNKLLRLSVWSLQALPVPEWVSSHNPKTSMLGYLVIRNCFTCVLKCVVICLCVFALWWTMTWSAYTFLPKVSWDGLQTLRWISSHGKRWIDCYNILKIFSFTISQRDLRQF